MTDFRNMDAAKQAAYLRSLKSEELGKELTKLKKEELQELAASPEFKIEFTPQHTKENLISMLEGLLEAEKEEAAAQQAIDEKEDATARQTAGSSESDNLELKLAAAQATAPAKSKGILYVVWLKQIDPPEWHITVDQMKGVQVFAATDIELEDNEGKPYIMSIYRIPDTAMARKVFSVNPESVGLRVLKPSEVTEIMRIKLAVSDAEKKKAERRHQRLMRKEGVK